ncbi:hypothetical protein [Chelativorans sp. YIM 93263]|uniref:hypothetical protein n=1 Tax=Chelativorans sp. YIM 93263 TaxID=2906648 RepID=UPI0023792867|nr:hypothetical protein [Chelativorans sp. YIM 93263]
MPTVNQFRAAAVLSLFVMAGCTNTPRDVSSNFAYMPSNNYMSTGKGVGQSVLVPEACLGAPADQSPEPAETHMTVVPQLGPHLPPGCANAYNLQLMAEQKRDLIEGRALGAAPAAPSARAARRYIYEEGDALGGAHERAATTDMAL